MELVTSDSFLSRHKLLLLIIGFFCLGSFSLSLWYQKSRLLRVAHIPISTIKLMQEAAPSALEPNVTKRLSERFAHYEQVCQATVNSIGQDRKKLDNSALYQKHYAVQPRVVIDRKAKIAVCLQAKGGSSFWKHLFYHIKVKDGQVYYSKDRVETKFFNFVSLNSFQKKVEQLNAENYTMFAFGKNPWSRLVSLYRQKVEGVSHDMAAYRYVKAACLNKPCDTFKQLLDCVLHTWNLGIPDRHWEPLAMHCALCLIPYKHIGHTERMNEEATHIFQSAGLKGNISNLLEETRRNSIRTVEEHSRDVDFRSYYNSIPRETIDSLRDMYKHDISLLGYPDNPF